MATMRTYGDGCGIAHALDLVGERWALLVVRELLLGPKRFTDLRDGLPNASPNVLSQRLRELEQAAIVRRRKLPPPAGSWVYELTDWGRELKPIAARARHLGAALAVVPDDAPVGTDSVILALGTFFDADAAGDLTARYELRLGENAFPVRIADGADRGRSRRRRSPGRDHRDRPRRRWPASCATSASSPRRCARRHQGQRRPARRGPVPHAVPTAARE